RLIGVFFGLLVYGAVEHLLWPVRARDALRACLAEILHLLANLARSGSDKPPAVIADEVDSWRRRISQKVGDMQGFIESSKFESGDLDVDEIQKRTGDGQLVFVLLLSLSRQSRDTARLPDAIREVAIDLDSAVATALEAMATRLVGGSQPAMPDLDGSLLRFESSVAADTETLDKETATHFAARLALYRALVAAVKQISSKSMRTARDRHEARVFAAEKTLTAEPK